MAEKICTNIGHGGGPVLVHVEDDKIIRVRPLVFADDEEVPTWTLEAGGRKFTPLRKDTVAPYGMTEKARIYADDRIKLPDAPGGLRPSSASAIPRTGASRATCASAGTRPSTSSAPK